MQILLQLYYENQDLSKFYNLQNYFIIHYYSLLYYYTHLLNMVFSF